MAKRMDNKRTTLPADLQTLLDRLSAELRGLYGERYQGLVLYGSYARGEADGGSDVDLLLLLEGETDPVTELRKVHPIKWPLALEAGYTVALVPVGVGEYLKPEEPYLHNALKEGVPI